MAPPYRTRIFGVAAKIETTIGVYSTPTFAANGIRVNGVPTLVIAHLEDGDQGDAQTNQLIGAPRVPPAGSYATIELSIAVRPKGFAPGIPQHGVFLRGAGMLETIDATGGSEKVTYSTLDEGQETFSMLLNNGNVNFQLIGCSCNARRTGQAGQTGLWTFSIRGVLAYSFGANPVAAALSGLSLTAFQPIIWRSNSTFIGNPASPEWGPATAQPLHPRSFELDLGNVVTDRLSATAADVIISTFISNRRVTLGMLVERVDLSQFNPFDVARADGRGDLGGATHDTRVQINTGAAQYNREIIDTGYWELGMPGDADLDGLKGWQLSGPVNATNGPGGRELRIIYS